MGVAQPPIDLADNAIHCCNAHSDMTSHRLLHVRRVIATLALHRDGSHVFGTGHDVCEHEDTETLAHELAGALVLVSCTKSKLDRPAPSADLYCSPAFRLKRAMIERVSTPWAILSAKHGIVDPGDVIEPYDVTLVGMGLAARREWSRRVMADLLPLARNHGRVVALAGRSYVEYLVAPLLTEGIDLALPLKGLSQGRQLAWLTAQQ